MSPGVYRNEATRVGGESIGGDVWGGESCRSKSQGVRRDHSPIFL